MSAYRSPNAPGERLLPRDHVCGSCGGAVSLSDAACPDCGTIFHPKDRTMGQVLHPVFEVLLVLWALLLPVDCLVTYARYGALSGLFENWILFFPWITGVIALGVLTFVFDPKRH